MKGYNRPPAYDLRACKLADVAHLFATHHAYASTGKVCTYAFSVVEGERVVAGFLWQPPPPQSARTVCRALPHGVLSLSRMVATERDDRSLRHISKPLRRQMRRMIDRTRWPVLVTYSDESVDHTGYVYKVSGWTATDRNLADTLEVDGRRVSRYSCGAIVEHDGAVAGKAWIQRWEHWATDDPVALFDQHWERVAIPGKFWRSGSQAHTYRRRATVTPVV